MWENRQALSICYILETGRDVFYYRNYTLHFLKLKAVHEIQTVQCSLQIFKQGQAFQNRVRKSLHIAPGLIWSPAENYGNLNRETLTCTQYIEHFWKHTSSSLPSSLIIFATFQGKLKIANLCWVMQTCFQVQSSPPQWPIMIRPMTY